MTTPKKKNQYRKRFHSPVRPQPELLHRVLDRDEVPDVEGDRVGEVLGGRVCRGWFFILEERKKRGRG